jgi:ADP-heptose:LPS heptosyltransferase
LTTSSSRERLRKFRASVWEEAREWRARRFDLAVLFPNSFAPALVAALARVPFSLGYATQGAPRF